MKLPFGRTRMLYAAIGAALLLTAGAASALDVGGRLEGGEWSVADSPVRVTGDLLLPQGKILVIHPGVRIEFTGPYRFLVNGTLRAVGSRDSLILFTSARPDVDSLRWGGLRFVNAARETELRFCRIEYGWARGAWPLNCGGGIYIESCSPRITRCSVVNNRSDSDGGGIYGWFTTSLFQNNLIAENYSGNFGGGMYLAYANSRIQNCTVAFDTARGWGGGIFLGTEAKPFIVNCIVTHNFQDRWGGSLQDGDAFFADLARVQSAVAEVSFSCIRERGADPFPGAGNIIANPLYKNITNAPYDYHLNPASPCVDAGDPNMNADGEPDRLVNIINMGAYGGTDEATLSLPVFANDLIDAGVGVQFGEVRTGQTATREVRVENKGHYRLFVRDVRFDSPAFSVDSARVDTVAVPAYTLAPVEPGEKLKIIVGFSPTELRTYNARMTFFTSDTLQAPPQLNVGGTGIDPVASLDDTLDFGAQQIDVEVTRRIEVRNTGRSDLRLTSQTIQGDGYTARINDELIAPGQSGTVNVTFKPTHAAAYPAALTIRSNDRSLLVTLLGIGRGPKMAAAEDGVFMGYVYFNGDTARRQIMLYNQGNLPLIVSQAATAQPAVFSTELPVGGLTIQPLDSGAFTLRFHPQQANRNYSDTLTVSSSNYPLTAKIALSGRGMAEPGRYMFGHQSGVWTWQPGNSIDFIVLDSVYIPAHQRLKIEAGARVLFEPGAKFIADGEVRAIGTPQDSIFFLPRDPSGTPASRWDGIRIANEDGTRLVYCNITGTNRGIRVRESSPTIQFCRIFSNGDSSGAIDDHDGGGIYMENAGTRIIGCTIENNFARGGGGIFLLNSQPNISNNIIRLNTAREGGGVFMRFQATALMQNNLIYANRAIDDCGGVKVVDHSNPRLVNNTIVLNDGAGLAAQVRSVPTVINTILWDNYRSYSFDGTSNGLISYSDIQGGSGGTANLDTLPGFVNPAGWDFTLASGSPLIDRGNPEPTYRDYYLPPSQGTLRNDIGAFGGPVGGGFAAPDITISVFQNPAFPNWLDLFISSTDSILSAPACSLEWNFGQTEMIALDPLGPFTWRGQWQAPGAGEAFISVDAEIVGLGERRVARRFDVAMLGSGEGGSLYLADWNGRMTIPPGSHRRELVLVAGAESMPPRATNELIFISPPIYIRGLDEELSKDASIEMEMPGTDGWDEATLARAALYRRTPAGYERLPGGWNGSRLVGATRKGGGFVAAIGDAAVGDDAVTPVSALMLKAYPNPFNQRVTLEFNLDRLQSVRLAVYDIGGRKVAELVKRMLPAGRQTAVWEGRADLGGPLPTGIYWAHLHTSQGEASVKLLLLR